jgi:hypothetical protein
VNLKLIRSVVIGPGYENVNLGEVFECDKNTGSFLVAIGAAEEVIYTTPPQVIESRDPQPEAPGKPARKSSRRTTAT